MYNTNAGQNSKPYFFQKSIALLSFLFLVTSCIDTDDTTEHTVFIANQTTGDLFYNYSVMSYEYDFNLESRRIIEKIGSVLIPVNSLTETLFNLEYTKVEDDIVYSLESIKDKINYLNFYRIIGTDTIESHINILEMNNWTHNSFRDSAPAEWYFLGVTDKHFD